MQQPKLALKTKNGELTITLNKALWIGWCLATYPLQLFVGWYFFGTLGLWFVGCMILLNFRGRA